MPTGPQGTDVANNVTGLPREGSVESLSSDSPVCRVPPRTGPPWGRRKCPCGNRPSSRHNRENALEGLADRRSRATPPLVQPRSRGLIDSFATEQYVKPRFAAVVLPTETLAWRTGVSDDSIFGGPGLGVLFRVLGPGVACVTRIPDVTVDSDSRVLGVLDASIACD